MRGNAKIIQELVKRFRGAGWNVIKLILDRWDELFARDGQYLLQRLGNLVDGDEQRISTADETIQRLSVPQLRFVIISEKKESVCADVGVMILNKYSSSFFETRNQGKHQIDRYSGLNP